MAATMLTGNVLPRIDGSVEIFATYDVQFKAKVNNIRDSDVWNIQFARNACLVHLLCMLSREKTTIEDKKGHKCFSD